jgi:hypothetical protein
MEDLEGVIALIAVLQVLKVLRIAPDTDWALNLSPQTLTPTTAGFLVNKVILARSAIAPDVVPGRESTGRNFPKFVCSTSRGPWRRAVLTGHEVPTRTLQPWTEQTIFLPENRSNRPRAEY